MSVITTAAIAAASQCSCCCNRHGDHRCNDSDDDRTLYWVIFNILQLSTDYRDVIIIVINSALKQVVILLQHLVIINHCFRGVGGR